VTENKVYNGLYFLSGEIFASISGLFVKGKSDTLFDAHTRKL
jgi:hypothetical protein